MDPHIQVKVRAMDHLTGVKIKAMDLIPRKIKTNLSYFVLKFGKRVRPADFLVFISSRVAAIRKYRSGYTGCVLARTTDLGFVSARRRHRFSTP